MRQRLAVSGIDALRAFAVAGGVITWLNPPAPVERHPLGASHKLNETPRGEWIEYKPGRELFLPILERIGASLSVQLSTTSLEPSVHSYESSARSEKNVDKISKQYDFVIVGGGTAGLSALEQLRKQCPQATIALLDPLPLSHLSVNDDRVKYYPERAARLDPRQRMVHLGDNQSTCIRYQCALLLATGARGAPPPTYLVDEKARKRVFELRPTILPSETERPVLTRSEIRQRVLEQARNGETIGILGSGWEAVDLAVSLATQSGTTSKAGIAQPHLFFGLTGPLHRVLPAYLSTAVTKRLKVKRIQVHDQTVVRYVSPHHRHHQRQYDQADNNNNNNNSDDTMPSRIELYTARSSDFMDTKKTVLHWLVIAPETAGAFGCAALPTTEVPAHLVESSEGRPWYQTWANLSMHSPHDPSLIVCYKEDGRIAVNTELCACSGVYAAGSVAKYANGLTGNADLAGVGVEDAFDAGRAAASNMAKYYYLDTLGRVDGAARKFPFMKESNRDEKYSLETRTKDPLPVWRSDVRSLNASTIDKTALARIGIHALCVGDCDSERYSTHGIWWTNLAARRRIMQWMEEKEDEFDAQINDKTNNSNNKEERDITKSKQFRRAVKKSSTSVDPVYGFGVIYYKDCTGKIHGVMTWGIPFTVGNDETLNSKMVQHIKRILMTNGGFTSIDSDRDIIRLSNYLVRESKQLVAMAFARYSGDEQELKQYQLSGPLEDFPRPLHRFTEARPPNVRSVGVLKRKDGHGNGVLGQDLFDRFVDTSIADVPIPVPSTTLNVGFAEQQAKNMYEWDVYHQKAKRWEENENRARPPREEPLWIRKGDELRNITMRDSILGAYSNIFLSSVGKG